MVVISSEENSSVLRLIKCPRLRVSIKRISSVRLRNLPLALSRLKNHKQAGICVFKNSLAGRLTKFNKPLPEKCFRHGFEGFVLAVEQVYFVVETGKDGGDGFLFGESREKDF